MTQRILRKGLILTLCLLTSLSWAKSKDIDVFSEKADSGEISFFVRNDKYCPVTIKLTFPKLEGFNRDVSQEYFLVPARVKKLKLQKITPSQSKRLYNFSYRYYLGDTQGFKQDKDIKYLFPWAHGEKYELSQGHNGPFTHKGQIRYALDFTMDEGTAIHAAQDGVVIEVEESFSEGGVSDAFKNKDNHITVYQADGSFAQYVHLKKDGALVYVGQKIKAGQKIGLSGNTGYSSGPHLHFCVFKPRQNGWDSIPVRFADHTGALIDLTPGYWYYSTHPGMEKYDVTLGHLLTDEDFKDFSKAAKIKQEVKTLQLKIDSTYIIFAENGYDRDIEMTVNFNAENMRLSKGIAVTVKVPAHKRVYVQLLRQDKTMDKFRFTYKYTYKWLE